MAGTIYDIMWRRDIYPSKKEIVKDIRHHELYVLEKDNKIIGAMVLNHEYDECYNKLSWQIFADDDEVLILHRLCIHPQYRGCGKFLIKQAIEIAKFLKKEVRGCIFSLLQWAWKIYFQLPSLHWKGAP